MSSRRGSRRSGVIYSAKIINPKQITTQRRVAGMDDKV